MGLTPTTVHPRRRPEREAETHRGNAFGKETSGSLKLKYPDVCSAHQAHQSLKSSKKSPNPLLPRGKCLCPFSLEGGWMEGEMGRMPQVEEGEMEGQRRAARETQAPQTQGRASS